MIRKDWLPIVAISLLLTTGVLLTYQATTWGKRTKALADLIETNPQARTQATTTRRQNNELTEMNDFLSSQNKALGARITELEIDKAELLLENRTLKQSLASQPLSPQP